MGDISGRLDVRYHGIAIQAVALTFATCFCLLVAYRFGLFRVSESFNAGVVAATCGVALVYLVSLMLALAGVRTFSIFGGGVPGILASVVVVILAGMNLVIDFAFVGQCAQKGLPKYMEWYTALGLIVTLIWLYTEILRLISKARSTEERG